MLTTEIIGTLPTINSNLAESMRWAGNLMLDSVRKNFMAAGRPDKWPQKKDGSRSFLFQSGDLLRSIQMRSDATSATVSISTRDVPYAAIHNFGGVIKHPGSSKFQVFHIGGAVVFTHGTKPHDIHIPQRQYMMFQEEDRRAILERIGLAIFTQSERTH